MTAPTPTTTIPGTTTYFVSQVNDSCESVRIPVLVQVLNVSYAIIDTQICMGSTFSFAGQNLSIAGTYHDTLQASNGCDSIITLNLSFSNYLYHTLDTTICPGQTFSFNGIVFSQDTVYIDTLPNELSCPTIVTLNLSLSAYHPGHIFDTTICPGQSIIFGGQTYASAVSPSAGITDTVPIAGGCFRIDTLSLHLGSYIRKTLIVTICHGQGYSFNGQTYNERVTPAIGVRDTFQTAGGCDSIITLQLTVNPYLESSLNATICQGDSFLFNGQYFNSTQNYTDTVQTSGGCDSIIHLNLTVNPVLTVSLNEEICEGTAFTLGNNSYTVPGNYQDILTAVTGCDSIVNLTLTVLPLKDTLLKDTTCSGVPYSFGGNQLTQTGTYSYATPSNNGCDSTITLNLYVIPAIDTTFTNVTICNGDSFQFDGQEYTTTKDLSHVYTSFRGCDSVYTVRLTVLPPAIWVSDTIYGCKFVTYQGADYWTDTVLRDTVKAVSADCDSIFHSQYLIIQEMPVITDTVFAEICNGEFYSYRGEQLFDEGIYSFTGVNPRGCDTAFTVVLTVHPLPTPLINYDPPPTGLCIGEEINLKASGADEYEWFVEGHSLSTTSELNLKLYDPLTHVLLEGSTEFGCKDTMGMVLLGHPCCDGFLNIPTGFTPNGDGLNDEFGAAPGFYPLKFSLAVYNRWGQVVFKSNNPQLRWNGTLNGKPCESGTYFYQISGTCAAGDSFQRKGAVVLIR